jgi:hypothetical protein
VPPPPATELLLPASLDGAPASLALAPPEGVFVADVLLLFEQRESVTRSG